jgi:hypothetical protein
MPANLSAAIGIEENLHIHQRHRSPAAACYFFIPAPGFTDSRDSTEVGTVLKKETVGTVRDSTEERTGRNAKPLLPEGNAALSGR